MRKLLLVLGLIILSSLFSGCNLDVSEDSNNMYNFGTGINNLGVDDSISNDVFLFDLKVAGDEIITFMQEGAFFELSQWVHPQKGVRFTPYTYVDTELNNILYSQDFDDIDGSEYIWGYYDGRGDDIIFTVTGYLESFPNNVNFSDAPQVIENKNIVRGNSLSNFDEIYNNSQSIEYYFSGFEAKYEGMDWQSLTLIFEELEGKYYLVGVINGSWTI